MSVGRDEKAWVAEGIVEGGRLANSTVSGSKGGAERGMQVPTGSNAR